MHPTDEMLVELFLTGSPIRREAILAHLTECMECAETPETISKVADFDRWCRE